MLAHYFGIFNNIITKINGNKHNFNNDCHYDARLPVTIGLMPALWVSYWMISDETIAYTEACEMHLRKNQKSS